MFDSTDWRSSFAVDRSPLALAAPQAAARLHRIAPNARVIAVLCDPVKRAWSAINHENKRWVHHDPSRAKMIDKEIDMLEQTDRREPNEAPGLHRGHDDVKDRQGESEQDGAIAVKHLDRLEYSEDLFAQLFNSCGADCGYGILRL